VIIGSGISGLTAAAVLSKLGKICIILEYHDKAGGLLNVFTKEGFEIHTGLHFVN